MNPIQVPPDDHLFFLLVWVPSDYSNAGLHLFGLTFDLNLIDFNPILSQIEY